METVASFPHFPGNAVEEAFLQPLPGLRAPDGGMGLLVALHGGRANAGMDRCIVGAHIVPEKPVELLQGGDGIQIECIEPGLLERPELALYFRFRGAVTDLRM